MQGYSFHKFLFLTCGLLLVLFGYAQEKKVDGILKHAEALHNSMPDSSLYYCKEAQAISKKENLKKEYAYSLLCEARYNLLKGNLKPTQEGINDAMKIFDVEKHYKSESKHYVYLEEIKANKFILLVLS